MKYNNKKCKHSTCLISKVGLDFHCNTCGGIVLDMTEQNFEDTPDVDLINDLRAELDEEARMENEIGGHIEDRKGGGIHEGTNIT